MVVIWSIWLIRNETLFKKGHKGVSNIVSLAKKLSWDWLGARFVRPFVAGLEDWIQNPITCFFVIFLLFVGFFFFVVWVEYP